MLAFLSTTAGVSYPFSQRVIESLANSEGHSFTERSAYSILTDSTTIPVKMRDPNTTYRSECSSICVVKPVPVSGITRRATAYRAFRN